MNMHLNENQVLANKIYPHAFLNCQEEIQFHGRIRRKLNQNVS